VSGELYIENTTKRLKKLFNKLQDDVLDEYNKGAISEIEMKNIIQWCNKMKQNMVEELKNSK